MDKEMIGGVTIICFIMKQTSRGLRSSFTFNL